MSQEQDTAMYDQPDPDDRSTTTAQLIAWLRAFEGPGSAGMNEAADELERLTREVDRINIVTPCHGLPPMFHYGYEGRPYMQEQVVDGLECPAAGCYNTWTAEGKADDD